MNTIKNLFLVSSIIVSTNILLIGQPGDFPMAQEPGKCYAKCLIADKYETIEETFAIYTGEFNKAVELDSMYFKIDEYSNELIYLGYKNNLDHFQLGDIESFEKIVFLTNPEEVEDYIEETIVYQRLNEAASTEWREVVCGDKVTGNTIAQVQNALISRGYLNEAHTNNILTIEIKAALTDYQKENGLPIGQLDVKTLKSLGIQI